MHLAIKNWSSFQHYNDRNPNWIKLHVALLSSQDWVALADASRVLAVASMVLAAKTNGIIDASAGGLAYIKRVAYLNSEPDFKPLIECGFMIDASTMLADASTMLAQARPEREKERKRESKKVRKVRAAKRSENHTPDSALKRADLGQKRGTRLPNDWEASEADRSFAEHLGLSQGEIDHAEAEFRDYWIAATGRGAAKLDWAATWRNNVRRFAGRKKDGQRRAASQFANGNRSQAGSLVATARRMLGEADGAGEDRDGGREVADGAGRGSRTILDAG